MSLAAGTSLGHYIVIGPLGAGGMGEVYRARDSRLERDVAIKVLPETFAADADRLARFTREARTLAALNHPNIAAIYGIEETGGVRGLVMELVDGEDLAERLERGAVPGDEAVAIARQIADALEAAHEQGIIHRDLKPANIKVKPDGTVKVLDFGLAKAVDPAGGPSAGANAVTITSPATQLGVIVGTAAYMSPEQAKGHPVDRRADIWAFGVVFYEMLSGARVFKGNGLSELVAAVLRDAPDFTALPGTTPARVRRLIERCLERDLRMRLRDIGEARVELTRISSSEADHTGAATTSGVFVAPATKMSTRWSPLQAGVLLAAGAAIAVAATWAMSRATASPSSQYVRAVLNLPSSTEPTEFLGVDRPLAVSADGNRVVAVIARRSTDKTVLFVRSVGQLEWKELVGTEDASYPFWSPDSKSIGFFAAGQLRRVDLADGIVRTLCDAPAGRGGDWSTRGVIVFAASAVGGLSTVSDAGGAAQMYSPPASAAESQRLPHFLPDGRRVLFVSNGRQPNGLWLFDPDAPEGQRATSVMESQTEAKYIEPGYLAYVRDENLMLQPFDAKTGRTTGDARPIATNVGFDVVRRYASVDISPAGPFVYLPVGKVEGHALEWMDQSGSVTALPITPMNIGFASLAADGARVLLSTIGAHGEIGLVIADLIRGVVTQIPGSTMRYLGRFVDGDRRIAFQEFGQPGTSPLVTADLSGGDEKIAVNGDGSLEFHAGGSSADGKLLLFSQVKNIGKVGQLMVVDLAAGGTPRPLLKSNTSDWQPILSPSGRMVAYLVGDGEVARAGSRVQLAVAAFPNASDHVQVTVSGLQTIAWGWLSADELYFQDLTNKVWSVKVTERAGQLVAAQPTPLFGGKAVDPTVRLVGYSTAGHRFLAAHPAGRPAPVQPVIVSDWRAALAGTMK